MTDNALSKSDYLLAEDIFREAIESNLADEDNLAAIRGEFADRAGQAWADGEIVVEVKRLVVDHLWQRVNTRAAQATTKMLRDVDTGQTSMALDDWLDQPITVGKHRRTTIRYIDSIDLTRLINERRANLEAAQAAFATAERAVAVLAEVLDKYQSIEDGLRAGAFEMHGTDDVAAESVARSA